MRRSGFIAKSPYTVPGNLPQQEQQVESKGVPYCSSSTGAVAMRKEDDHMQ
jgi:hypothetical protein